MGGCGPQRCCEQLAAWRRQAPPPDLPEGVELLDVAMAEDVVAVRREPFSGRSDQAS
jgi:hypothetical protein